MPSRSRAKRTATKKKAVGLNASDEAAFSAELTVSTTQLITSDPIQYRQGWLPTAMVEQFRQVRALREGNELMGGNDFVGSVLYIKQNYFSEGFRVLNDNPRIQKWIDKLEEGGLSIRRMVDDIWNEFLAMDNAIVFWRKGLGGAPLPVVLDCELANYTDTFGLPVLKFRPGRVVLTDDQKRAVGARWAAAYEKGEEITMDEKQGEFFKVLTRAKLGKGLCKPRLVEVFEGLSILELLEAGDWGAAWELKDIVQHITKGHEIKQGDKAGDPKHFINKRQQQAIQAALRGKVGPRRIITNFDVQVAWKYLDPKYLDPEKYRGTLARLEAWAGVPALVYKEGRVTDEMMVAFAAEGRKQRELVAEMVESILNHPSFGRPGKEKVQVGWNPHSFLSTKMLLEWVRASYSNGLISPQTARAVLGVDDERESRLMLIAHDRREEYTPPFEPKQGMLSGEGGRPSDKAGTGTNPTAGTGAGDVQPPAQAE